MFSFSLNTCMFMFIHVYSSGELLKSMVYGAMDGIVTTFAIVCAASGAEQSDSVIVTMVQYLTCLQLYTYITFLVS